MSKIGALAYSRDITIFQKLISYQWGDYYYYYYLQGCGGEYGTNALVKPSAKVHLDIPTDIRGFGGTAEVNLLYTCQGDLCSSAFRDKTYLSTAITSVLISCVLLFMTS